MHALPEIQSRFYEAILGDAAPIESTQLSDMLDGESTQLKRRLAAYRRNTYGNFCNSLAATYSVVRKIVGEAFFREAAQQYIPDHPSTSGDLNDYGASFPDFLESYAHAQDLPYLPDVARLEWAIQGVLNAAEPEPADWNSLSTVAPERYGDLQFETAPCCVRFDTRWPVGAIWQVNQDSYEGEMTIDFSKGERVLVGLTFGELSVAAVTHAEAEFFDALRAKRRVTEAAEAALACDINFDFGSALQRWISNGRLRSASLGS